MIVHLYVPICCIGSPGVWPVGPNKVRLPHPGKGSVLSAPLTFNGDHNDNHNDDDDIYIMIKCLSVCVSRKMITSSWESPVTT